ncbi:hypothetical protein ACFCX4_18995 [Kitasatospora sp. NPDC056327]|uniref:hypothetical protein n=1 Tax=Kitasatospora sp. NPDC056327 TaxID=3345785 RepID=UPI0035D666D1
MSESPVGMTLAEAVDALADRFRAMPQSRLLGAVPGHPSRAAAGLALARWLATEAQRAETGPEATGAGTTGTGNGAPPRELPDAGPFAVGDQLAVVGHDLVTALAARPGEDTAAVRAEALGRVARTAAVL